MAEKFCPYHNRPGTECSCWCKGCGNTHPNCVCKMLKGVNIETEVSAPVSRSVMDLHLDTRGRKL